MEPLAGVVGFTCGALGSCFISRPHLEHSFTHASFKACRPCGLRMRLS